jgi:hypothetical protein
MASRPRAGRLSGLLALGTGALLLAMIGAFSGDLSPMIAAVAAAASSLVALLKRAYWSRIDGAGAPYSIAQAIGIPAQARSGHSTRRTRNPTS